MRGGIRMDRGCGLPGAIRTDQTKRGKNKPPRVAIGSLQAADLLPPSSFCPLPIQCPSYSSSASLCLPILCDLLAKIAQAPAQGSGNRLSERDLTSGPRKEKRTGRGREKIGEGEWVLLNGDYLLLCAFESAIQ